MSDLCHCPNPQLTPERDACNHCGLAFSRKAWKRDPRVKQAERDMLSRIQTRATRTANTVDKIMEGH